MNPTTANVGCKGEEYPINHDTHMKHLHIHALRSCMPFILCSAPILPVAAQQDQNQELKLNQDAVKMIQFDFTHSAEEIAKPLESPMEKKWMEYKNPFDEGIPRSLTDSLMAKKPKGYIRMCPYSIWTKRGEDPVYDVTVEGRPPELIMNEGPDTSKKLQTDYGHSLKPSTGRTYDMLNNSTPIEVGKIFKKYIKPLLPAKKSK